MKKRRIKKRNLRQDYGLRLFRFPKSKRSQETMGIGFGVIFSIILIIFFVVIAIIVIKSFLDVQKCSKLGIFNDRFNEDVKKTWNSQTDSHTFQGSLPGSIEYVCFANLTRSVAGRYSNEGLDISLYEGTKSNTFFSPISKACEMPHFLTRHLDIGKITGVHNPNCIPVEKGSIEIRIEKGLNDRFVNVVI